jgi:nitrogen fixation protein FixH
MPAMSGAHDSGLQALSLNKAGNYLLPINIVMPGKWEVKLTFSKGNKTVYRGRAKFDV